MTGVEKCRQILGEVNRVVIGKEEVVRNVLVSIVSGGHVLLEDIPGVGKTTLALSFSRAMNMSYGRIQFTPDVMPSDVTGYSVYNKATGQFDYKPGVIMCNFFLADEINRTSSKTQSALLEAMEEKKITVDGKNYMLNRPFVVMATQNPIGSIGTSLLPESQLDRFMMRLSMGYPDPVSEIDLLKAKKGGVSVADTVRAVANVGDIVTIQDEVSNVFIHDDIFKYIVDIVNATRKSDNILLGVSPRGSVAIANAARGMAYIEGRDYVVPDDVKKIVPAVINHRIVLSTKAKSLHLNERQVIDEIIGKVAVKSKQ